LAKLPLHAGDGSELDGLVRDAGTVTDITGHVLIGFLGRLSSKETTPLYVPADGDR